MSGMPIFLLLVFAAVFLLSFLLITPTFSGDRAARKRLKKRMSEVNMAFDRPSVASLLREEHLQNLSAIERMLESAPGMESLAYLIEQAGRKIPAYRFAFLSLGLGLVVATIIWILTRQWPFALVGFVCVIPIPAMKLNMERLKRMDKFEEQLPDALDTISRALRAGHPFNESLHLIGEEMDDPIAREFEITFADINYGGDTRSALLHLLERVPSVSMMAVITSVLIQRETGGNLGEVLAKISAVIRGRFRFARKVKTLSAEGRMSAWILTLQPLAMVVLLQVTTPDYLTMLVDDPFGQKLIIGSIAGAVIGLLWVRRIIRIQV